MIRTLLFDNKLNTITEGDERAIELWKDNPELDIWVDLQDEPEEVEKTLLEDVFELHPLAVHDATRHRHPPKIEKFDNNVFILLRGLDKDTSDINFGLIQLAVFVGERFFITRHNKDSVSADAVWEEVKSHPSTTGFESDVIFVKLFARVVRRFVSVLLSLEPRLDELESEIFEKPSDQILSELTRYKSQLRQLRRIANYHRQISTSLKNSRIELIGEELGHEINDIHEQLERSISLAELYYENASDLIDGYLAASSHQLNKVMQILTIFTVTFVPLTFIAGIYGMNFEYIPELKVKYGYFFVVGLMAIIVTAQLIYFKRKRWM